MIAHKGTTLPNIIEEAKAEMQRVIAMATDGPLDVSTVKTYNVPVDQLHGILRITMTIKAEWDLS